MTTVIFVGTSLDGFIAKRDGNLNWLMQYQNKEVGENYDEFIKTVDAIVVGRGTYETVLAYPSWPYTKRVYVLSTTLERVPEGLKGKVTVHSRKPKEMLEYLSREGYSRIYVDGGQVIQGFLKADCIDEMIITRVPMLLGGGIPLFGSLEEELRFDHETTTVLSNGLVKSHYRRRRSRS